jgi:Short C-terminal domain/Phospholipase_D-nuclease N-terminal
MLAYDYPVLGFFWSMLWLFLWILWFFLLFRVIMDVFRDDHLGGWGKAAWLIFVIILPFLGVFVYLIARGGKMGERDMQQARAQEAAFQDYVRQTAGTAPSTADEITKLTQLKDQGVITDAEFNAQKAKLLA